MPAEDAAQQPPGEGPPPRGLWAEREQIATHFNDVLMRFRLHALVGLGAIAAVAGSVLTRGAPESRCGAWSWLLVSLATAWLAVAFLDLFYYRKLRLGAVQAMLRLEEALPESERFSSTIERHAAWGARWAPGVFYGLILGVLGAGLRWSQADMCGKPIATVAPGRAPVTAAAAPAPPPALTRFKFGECVMPDAATQRETIVKIVGVTARAYRVFTHTLAAGELARAEDYKLVNRTDLEGGHTVVECPALPSRPVVAKAVANPTALSPAGDEPRRVLTPVVAPRPAAIRVATSQRPRAPRPLAPVSPVLW